MRTFPFCSGLNWLIFICRRIILPEHNWNSWAHVDTLRETHYLCEHCLPCFFFSCRLQVVIFQPVLCLCIAWNIPPSAFTRPHLPSPTVKSSNRINRNAVLHVTRGPSRPTSSNTPSCIVLKKDFIYCVVNSNVSHCKRVLLFFFCFFF